MATSRNTTLKNKDYGGAILVPHDMSEKMNGLRSTRKIGNLPDTQMENRAKSDRVKFSVKNSVETCEPDAWK